MKDSDTTNAAFEDLLAGKSGQDAPLAEFVRLVRSEASQLELPADAGAHVAAAATAVPEASTAPPSASEPRVRARRLRRRMVVLASVGGMLLATAGVGLAANGASPTDPLYGVDLAFERFGLWNGGNAERAEEVLALLGNGDVGLALGHAATTMAALPDQAHGKAVGRDLQAAANHLGASENEAPDGVDDLLAYIAEALGEDPHGVEGETVAAYAKLIRDSVLNNRRPVDPPVGGPFGSVPDPIAPPITVPPISVPPDPIAPPITIPKPPSD